MPDLTPGHWLLAALGAFGIGLARSGFAGVSLVTVLIFAFLFGARDSTGLALPMLLIGDLFAVAAFRAHARWDYIWRMLPPTCAGIVITAAFMSRISEGAFRPVIGAIVLMLTLLQIIRLWRPAWLGDVPHARGFAWTMGLLAGVTTMLANASGPIVALYALAVALPKLQFVGTNAWFFLIVNAFKVPFSMALGLIHGQSLALNVLLTPAIAVGLFGGRWLVQRVPQHVFDGLLLVFAAVASLRLLGVF
jgi:uncharacterized membrane protein YfcA